MTPEEAHGQAFENGRAVGDAEGYARGLRDARSVDAVEVVRCGECKHCRISHPAGKPTPFYFCPDIMGHSVKLNDFCSYGERRN